MSVVVPVFDAEEFLEGALRSVLEQDYSPLEVIVVDDGSRDGSARVAARFEGVRCLRQENSGPGAARNRGIADATGSILAFLDSDDLWTPGKLALQVRRIAEHAGDVLSIALFRYFLEPGREIPPSFNRGLLDRDLVGRIPSTLVVRREVFERVGEFEPSLGTGEDVDWFARAKDLGIPTEVVPRVLLRKRVHDRNTSMSAGNTGRLLRVLERSIRRQRGGTSGKPATGGGEGNDR